MIIFACCTLGGKPVCTLSIAPLFSDESGTPKPASTEQPKTEDVLLRLLCRIAAYESATVARMADELQRLARDTSLPDVVRGTMLAQIILVDVVQRKLSDGGQEGEVKFASPTRLNGIFVPEVPYFLTRVIKSDVLRIGKDESAAEA